MLNSTRKGHLATHVKYRVHPFTADALLRPSNPYNSVSKVRTSRTYQTRVICGHFTDAVTTGTNTPTVIPVQRVFFTDRMNQLPARYLPRTVYPLRLALAWVTAAVTLTPLESLRVTETS